MRHLGSIALSVILAPIIYVLIGLGVSKTSVALSAGAAKGSDWGAAGIGFVALAVAAGLYALLVMTRLSPLGPVLAGLIFLGIQVYGQLEVASLPSLFDTKILGERNALKEPLVGFLVLLAIPLFATIFSPRRWRSKAQPAVAAPAGGTYAGSPYGGMQSGYQSAAPAYPTTPPVDPYTSDVNYGQHAYQGPAAAQPAYGAPGYGATTPAAPAEPPAQPAQPVYPPAATYTEPAAVPVYPPQPTYTEPPAQPTYAEPQPTYPPASTYPPAPTYTAAPTSPAPTSVPPVPVPPAPEPPAPGGTTYGSPAPEPPAPPAPAAMPGGTTYGAPAFSTPVHQETRLIESPEPPAPAAMPVASPHAATPAADDGPATVIVPGPRAESGAMPAAMPGGMPGAARDDSATVVSEPEPGATDGPTVMVEPADDGGVATQAQMDTHSLDDMAHDGGSTAGAGGSESGSGGGSVADNGPEASNDLTIADKPLPWSHPGPAEPRP